MAGTRRRSKGQARPGLSTARAFLHEHSLSLVLLGTLLALVLAYSVSDKSTHFGSFLGNAVADWLGMLVFVVATKYFFEVGSGESREPPRRFHEHAIDFLVTHSLTVVLVLSGAAWVVVYLHSDVDGKYGQVVGNIVSEWTQLLGLVVITKYARERGSKEGE
jgi:hypothetical protein